MLFLVVVDVVLGCCLLFAGAYWCLLVVLVGVFKIFGPLPGPPSPGPALPLDHPKFRAFFPSPATKFVLFFPLWGSSRGILVLFLKAGALKCALGVLWLSCASPGGPEAVGVSHHSLRAQT